MPAHLPALRLLPRLFAAALVPVLVAGCAGGGDRPVVPAQAAAPAPDPSGLRRFVGAVPEANGALLAVLVDEEAGSPRVRAYLCDSTSLFEWFRGASLGSEVTLSSPAGATLQATVGATAVTGTVTLPDGRAVPVRADQATGFADLFDVRGAPDGTITGTSAAGARLAGRVGDRATEEGMYPASVTVTSATGQQLATDVLVAKVDVGQTRWIVSADGQTLHGTDVHPLQGVKGAAVRN